MVFNKLIDVIFRQRNFIILQIQYMKLFKINPESHQIITKNANSKDMPLYLIPTLPRYFEFNQIIISPTNKKNVIARNSSSVEITDEVKTIKNFYHSFIPKNESNLSELLVPRFIDQQKTEKKIYINHILNQKKEYLIEPNYVEDHRRQKSPSYQKYTYESTTFKKPYIFTKQVDQLSKSRIINRKPFSTPELTPTIKAKSKRQLNDILMTSRFSHIQGYKSEYKSPQKSDREKLFQRLSFEHTIEKHKLLYNHLLNRQKKNDEEKVMMANAISNLAAGNRIMDILKKNRKKYKNQEKN